ncbi:hypothetical protein [Clostridioides difficile]|nr:hypothetical protein [Clostridioides difficile]
MMIVGVYNYCIQFIFKRLSSLCNLIDIKPAIIVAIKSAIGCAYKIPFNP